MAQRLKRLPEMWETWVWYLGQEDPLEKEMATHSSILAWRTPRTEEPGGLLSMGSKESNTTERLHFHFLFVFNSVRVLGFPGGSVVQSLPASARDAGDSGLIPGSGRSSEGGNGNPTPEFLSEKSQGPRNLVDYNLWSQRIRHHWAYTETYTANTEA